MAIFLFAVKKNIVCHAVVTQSAFAGGEYVCVNGIVYNDATQPVVSRLFLSNLCMFSCVNTQREFIVDISAISLL